RRWNSGRSIRSIAVVHLVVYRDGGCGRRVGIAGLAWGKGAALSGRLIGRGRTWGGSAACGTHGSAAVQQNGRRDTRIAGHLRSLARAAGLTHYGDLLGVDLPLIFAALP